MTITTEVLETRPAVYSQMGQFLYRPLADTDQQISQGLAQRMVSYAAGRLKDQGFLNAVERWEVIVGTMDADSPPANRAYYVDWKNPEGTKLSVVGILTNRGWPCLDHGLAIETC